MSSTLRVNTITNSTGDGAVDFPKGITGDGSNLNFDPKIIGHNPNFFGTNIPIETNITITFNQNIKFWGSGTIEIREGSSSGTVAFSFSITNNTGGSGLQIVNDRLIITPPSDLSYNKTYFVVIPSAGIAGQTSEIYFAGDNTYSFQTLTAAFLMSGGSQEFVVYNSSSPTNYYKYHIFTGTSSFTLANPSSSATDFALMMVAGGGGGGGYPSSYRGGGGGGAGGLITRTGPSLGLAAGTYNMTIGAGGYGYYTPNPNPSYSNQTYSQQGFDTHITPPTSPTTYNLRAIGGGGGGSEYGYYNNQGFQTSNPQGAGYGGPGGSGGGAYSQYNISSTQPTIHPGGSGVGGQGFPGGGNTFYQPPGNGSVGGGGGGAGGAGGRANASGSSTPNSNYWYAGHGGPGQSVPSFPFTDIFSGGLIPAPDFPMESQERTNGTFAGGGGGGAGPNSGSSGTYRGKGGPGGGGTGGGTQNPSEPDYPSPPGNPQSEYYANHGAKCSGGGGGGARESTPSYWAGSGGSGIAMIRYAYPAALV